MTSGRAYRVYQTLLNRNVLINITNAAALSVRYAITPNLPIWIDLDHFYNELLTIFQMKKKNDSA